MVALFMYFGELLFLLILWGPIDEMHLWGPCFSYLLEIDSRIPILHLYYCRATQHKFSTAPCIANFVC